MIQLFYFLPVTAWICYKIENKVDTQPLIFQANHVFVFMSCHLEGLGPYITAGVINYEARAVYYRKRCVELGLPVMGEDVHLMGGKSVRSVLQFDI